MICQDCLHYDICYYQEICTESELEELSKDDGCDFFTARSEWVHLPCNVGTVVYIPEIEVDKIERKLVTKIYRTTVDGYSVNVRYIMYHTRKGNNFTDSMLGKTVFLNREEAEKALEEKKC